VISVVAWVVACGLLGALAPNASGAGLAVSAIFILLLTAVAVVALAASVVDTVRLRRGDAGVRRQAMHRAAHYPVRAHAYSYPPRHGFTWAFSWVMMAILLGIGIASLPGVVDGVAYLAGAESSSTFLPISYGQDCGRSGCTTVTYGVLANGASVTWPDQVPLDQAFAVREPLWDWGFGSRMIDGDGTAIVTIIAGAAFNVFGVFILIHLIKLARRWLRHRQLGQQMAGVTRLPGGPASMVTPGGRPRWLPRRADPVGHLGGPASMRRRTSASPASPRSTLHQLSIHQVAPAASQEAGSAGSRCMNSPLASPSMITS
jgi:hypothetical protein